MSDNYKDQLQEDYLIHFGVPGMKWGHRKSPEYSEKRANAKSAYKEAKRDLRSARRMRGGSVGIKGLGRAREKQKAIDKASMKVLDKKAEYNASKKTSSEAASKAEFKTYRNAMSKSGIRGSAADSYYGGRSTKIYDSVKAKKGKEYADRIEKSVQNRAVATLVGSAAVLAGSVALETILTRRR